MTRPKSVTYELRIELDHTFPVIWRTFTVPADITLRKLHFVIQVTMGWENSHLHDFIQNKRRYSAPNPDRGGLGEPIEDESEFTIADLLTKPKQHLTYEYDFGDGWRHTITLVKIITEPCPAPQVLSGKGACPPEDCGGVHGYGRLLKFHKNPKSEKSPDEAEWMQSMMPDDFDPAVYAKDDVNEVLAKGVDALADEFDDLEDWAESDD